MLKENELRYQTYIRIGPVLQPYISNSRDVDQHFNLVMLSERMDESMVLMADALCLPLEEVTSLKNNVRKKDKIQQMTEDEKSVIARFQRPDQGACV